MLSFLGFGCGGVLEPGLEKGVGHIGSRVVISFYLFFYGCVWQIDEETGLGGASTTEEDLGGLAIVPCCGFGDYAGGF